MCGRHSAACSAADMVASPCQTLPIPFFTTAGTPVQVYCCATGQQRVSVAAPQHWASPPSACMAQAPQGTAGNSQQLCNFQHHLSRCNCVAALNKFKSISISSISFLALRILPISKVSSSANGSFTLSMALEKGPVSCAHYKSHLQYCITLLTPRGPSPTPTHCIPAAGTGSWLWHRAMASQPTLA